MLPKLLLVDDDETILRAMARGLRNDFDVKTFTSDAAVALYLAKHRIKVLPKPATPADVRTFLTGERSVV